MRPPHRTCVAVICAAVPECKWYYPEYWPCSMLQRLATEWFVLSVEKKSTIHSRLFFLLKTLVKAVEFCSDALAQPSGPMLGMRSTGLGTVMLGREKSMGGL